MLLAELHFLVVHALPYHHVYLFHTKHNPHHTNATSSSHAKFAYPMHVSLHITKTCPKSLTYLVQIAFLGK